MILATSAKLALRNTTRRRTRTLLTAGMVVLGVALLLLSLSWVGGIFQSILSTATALGGHVRIVQPKFAEREELQPLYENIPNVAPLEAALRAQPGVAGVEPRITTGVTISKGDQIGDVFGLVVGASERYFRERTGAKEKLIAGAWFSGAPNEAILGTKVASEVGAKVGDELILVGMTQDGSMSPIKVKLAGIAQMGVGGLDQQIFVPLSLVQYLVDIEGGATELLIYGDRYEHADRLVTQLRAAPMLKDYTVQAWSEREPWRSLSGTVNGMQSVIVGVIVFLTALGIWNTMMMSVLERTHEIGVLRAMGLSRWGTVRLFVGEALAIAILGGLLGVALGAYPAWLLETRGITIGARTAASTSLMISETMRGDLNWTVVGTSFCLGLLMALLGSLVPALRAASIQPVAAMRGGR
jgi:ABC-type lipoprotein release transport system permease subunit